MFMTTAPCCTEPHPRRGCPGPVRLLAADDGGAFYLSPAISHNLTASSMPALANVRPSGEKATAAMPLRLPRSVTRSFPDATSHSFTVSSPLPVANVLPSAENARHLTLP